MESGETALSPDGVAVFDSTGAKANSRVWESGPNPKIPQEKFGEVPKGKDAGWLNNASKGCEKRGVAETVTKSLK